MHDAIQNDRILRDRLRSSDEASDRNKSESTPVPHPFLGTTDVDENGDYPTIATAVFTLLPTEIDAAADEGAPVSYDIDDDQTIPASGVGSQVPPIGTHVVAHYVGGGYIFRFDNPT